MLLTPNKHSRPRISLRKVTHLVIHWVANPQSSATANRNYFESLKNKNVYASAHYIVGLNGEVIRCIPEAEVAYHAGSANSYSIGIENCHPDWDGKFSDITYKSLIELCVMLCKKYKLDPSKALLRHYDVTRKRCPRYYVDNEEAWQQLKRDVEAALAKEKQDRTLLKAVEGLVAAGVKLDVGVWGNMKTMNMKYAELMVCRIGIKFNKLTYKDTVEFLVSKGCIQSRQIWDDKKFRPEWCRALLIKTYVKLIRG